jgi:lipoprotein NlpI
MAWSQRRAAIGGFAAIGTLFLAGYFFLSMAQQSRNWAACVNADHAVAPDLTIAGCTAVAPSIILTADNRAVVFIDRGNAHLAKNEVDPALADYDEAIRLNPRSATAFYDRGILRQKQGDPGAAIADYDEAVRLNPKFANAFGNRGNAREAKGDFEGAIADYSEAIRIDPWNVAGYPLRGRAYFYAANFGAAVSDLARAAEDQPADTYSALWLYLARMRAEDPSAAAELETNAEHLKPADWPYPVVELYLGQRTPEATLAAPAKPDDRCEAQFYIGEWQLLRADRSAAIESLKAAADTCPKSFVEYRGARAELKRLGQ